ncbi:hypothetical protein tb265_12330 [Gemmatimonadetes bacterium T265]|nr:hypothetical protein tb265_12330 [Gemmatimonadetes bacterium T265]
MSSTPTLPADAPRWQVAPARDRITYQPRPDQARGNPTASNRDPGAIADVALPRVVALVAAGERAPFDAAVRGVCAPTHLPGVEALVAALQERPADGVVVSASVLAGGGARALATVAGLGRTFAATPLVVLVSAEVAPAVLIALGRSGARAVVDVRGAHGWAALQGLWPSSELRTLAQRAAARLAGPLAEVSPGMRRFVLTLFEVPSRVRTVRSYAPRFGVLPTTMMSRFFRAGLPAPRQYLAFARLARAAQLFESPRWTVGAVAAELEHSSAQAFSRHLYLQLGVRPREFRRRYDAGRMLERFAEELLVPYGEVLTTFEPF